MNSYKVRINRAKGNPVYAELVVYADSSLEAGEEVRDFIDEVSCGEYASCTIEKLKEFE